MKEINAKYSEKDKKEFQELFGFLSESLYETEESSLVVSQFDFEDDFDIVSIMDSAQDPDTGLIRNLKLDDRDLPSAKNYYDYVFNILGRDQNVPWLLQMWTLIILFAEYCPHCSDKRWLNLEYITEKVDKKFPAEGIVDHITLLENGVCPKCKKPKGVLIKEGLTNYMELVNILGQRSGKSASAASGLSYITHRYLKFPRIAELEPQALQKSIMLSGTFVALTFKRAFDLIWTPYLNIINNSSWFQDLHSFLDFHGEKYGHELYRKKDLFINYNYKNLRFYPTHPDGKILRGDTRIFSCIDELGMFPVPNNKEEDNFGDDEGNKRANADEAHTSLLNSLLTVDMARQSLLEKGFNPPPLIHMNISSPFHVRDKMMKLLEQSRTPVGSQSILGIQLPTWKVNPNINRDSRIILQAYEKNPITADRDWGAQPTLNASPFLTPKTVSHDLFVLNNSHRIHYQYDKPEFIYAKVEQLVPVTLPSIIVLDAGLTNNSFTLAGLSYNEDTYKTEVHTLLEIKPHDGRTIDFNAIYKDVILPVAKNTNAVAILADKWQSVDHLHRAKDDMGNRPDGKPSCLSKMYSPRRKDFDTTTSLMDNKNILYPKIDKEVYEIIKEGKDVGKYINSINPSEHLLLQMLTVRDVGHKSAPVKGEGFTDDLYRVIVLGSKIHDPAIQERLKEAKRLGLTQGGKQSPSPMFGGRSLGTRF